MAVTAPNAGPPTAADLGQPTSWSATVDALAAGRAVDTSHVGLVYIDEPADRAPRLFILAAGNVRSPLDVDHLTRSDLEPIEDPGQAWNAITVGAWTEQTDLSHDATFVGWTPLAPPGELSPFSRTSVSFKASWPHKPEVVFEGGNAAASSAARTVDTPPGLQLLTTDAPLHTGRLLTTMAGTSPATAQHRRVSAALEPLGPGRGRGSPTERERHQPVVPRTKGTSAGVSARRSLERPRRRTRSPRLHRGLPRYRMVEGTTSTGSQRARCSVLARGVN